MHLSILTPRGLMVKIQNFDSRKVARGDIIFKREML